MTESILTTIKKLLNIDKEETDFDTDVIVGINTSINILTQLGVGPVEGFSISDDSTLWKDFIGDVKYLESVKSFIHLKTKLIFDPPSGASILQMMKEEIKELEWRICELVEEHAEQEEEVSDG